MPCQKKACATLNIHYVHAVCVCRAHTFQSTHAKAVLYSVFHVILFLLLWFDVHVKYVKFVVPDPLIHALSPLKTQLLLDQSIISLFLSFFVRISLFYKEEYLKHVRHFATSKFSPRL